MILKALVLKYLSLILRMEFAKQKGLKAIFRKIDSFKLRQRLFLQVYLDSFVIKAFRLDPSIYCDPLNAGAMMSVICKICF